MKAAAVIVIYLVLAAGYVLWVPLFEAPDEPSHIHYVGFVAHEGRPPYYSQRPEVPGEGTQPPLYYWLLAPIYTLTAPRDPSLLGELGRASRWVYGYDTRAISRNRLLRASEAGARAPMELFAVDPVLLPLRALRWPGVAAGALALFLTMSAVRRMGGSNSQALLAAALLGLNPQFLFVAASVSNEAAAAALGAASFWAVAPVLGGQAATRRDYLVLASLAGLGYLTKLSCLPVFAVAGCTLLMLDRRPTGLRSRDALRAGVIGLIIAGPYLVWSALYRGDPLGMTAVWQSAEGFRTHEAEGGLFAYFTGLYPELTFQSYWGRFGWMNIPAPPRITLLFGVLSITGVVGFGRSWWSLRDSRRSRFSAAGHVYLVACILLMLAAHAWINLSIVQPQGRHLFPASSQIACLLASGLLWLVGERRPPVVGLFVFSLSFILALVAGYCLVAVIVPAYPPAAAG